MRLLGSTEASEDLRRLYRAHVDAVYAFFSYSVDATSAEDLTSTTFERVMRGWATYDPRRASERTWILAIARNVLIDEVRRQRRKPVISSDEQPALLESMVAMDDGPGRVLGPDELRTWLSCLDARQRTVLALRYGADLTTASIGEVLGLTQANVSQILSRALRRLRQAAEADGYRQRSAEPSVVRAR